MLIEFLNSESVGSPEVSFFSLYRSGLWRKNTLAWPSPAAVTATDASLKVESTMRFGHVSTGMLGQARSTCWRWNRGSPLCGHDTRKPGCLSARPTTSAFHPSYTWTPQKTTPPTAGERCPPGGRGKASSSHWAWMQQAKVSNCRLGVTSCWQLWRRTCVERSYMARVPSRYATAMRGRLERQEGTLKWVRIIDFGLINTTIMYWHLQQHLDDGGCSG